MSRVNQFQCTLLDIYFYCFWLTMWVVVKFQTAEDVL